MQTKLLVIIVILLTAVVSGAGGYMYAKREVEPETPGAKIGAAIDEIGKGFGRAAEKLEKE